MKIEITIKINRLRRLELHYRFLKVSKTEMDAMYFSRHPSGFEIRGTLVWSRQTLYDLYFNKKGDPYRFIHSVHDSQFEAFIRRMRKCKLKL